jgi:hypothetical protein
MNVPIKLMDFFVWLGLSRGFEQHAASLRNGLRMQAQTRPARARRRHSELWRRRATTPDGKRRDLIGMFIAGYHLTQNRPSKACRRGQYEFVRQGGATLLGRFCVSPN